MRYGFVVFGAGLLMGLPPLFAPHGKHWLAAHVTSMLNGLLLVAMGAAWSHLKLSAGQQRAAHGLALANAWTVIATGIFGAVFGMPGPVTGAGQPPPPLWQMVPQAAGLLFVVVASLASVGLMAWGLRGEPST
jgi:hydroxylaminobenzene mutase